MTELRDARLRKAMEQAPDAQLQPHARTRQAILAAAHGAVQPAWKRWWPRTARSGMPWAAALATVAMATLVTLMWPGQEVPGRREETQVAAVAPPAAAPAPAVAPSPAPGPVPATPPAPAAAPAPAPLPAPATAAPPATGSARASRSAPSIRDVPAAQTPVLADAAPAAADATTRPAAPEAPAAAAPAPPAAAPAAEPAPPAVAAAPAAPAPRPPPTVAQAAPQPQEAERAPYAAPSAAPRAALRAAPAPSMWTQVRIEASGRSVVVPTAQAGRLPSLLSRVLVSPGEPGGAAGSASLRLELARGDDDLGVLELVDGRWRWTPLRNTQQARLLQVDAELSEAVRAEAEFLLRR